MATIVAINAIFGCHRVAQSGFRRLRSTVALILLLLSTVLAGVSPIHAQTWTSLKHQPGVPLAYCLLLTDGGVMCQSGPDWYKLTPDLTGSYLNGTWSQVASMPAGYEPYVYAAAVLADGRAVIVGGEYNRSGALVLSNQGAIYDPKANIWTSLSPPNGWSYIGDASSVLLPNGKFLIGSKLDQRMAMLDPATLTWTEVSFTGKFDGFNSEENWTLLPDGSFLTVDVKNAPNTERFIPSTSTWVTAGNTPASLPSPPDEGPITIAPGVVYTPPGDMGAAILRPDGTVFAEGGNGHNAVYTPPAANSTAPGTWAAAPSFPAGLEVDDGPAVLLPNGHVLAVASPGDSGLGLSFFEFDGTNLIPVPQNLNAGADSTNYVILLLLPTGEALLVDSSTLVQIYTPSSATTYDPSWAPAITAFPPTLVDGSTYQITGTQFNGLSQASSFGDENENATNYPLIRITNNASGHVFYARTHDHSSMGVATGSTPVSTSFDVPVNTELGASKLVVVANGIPSLPVSVTVTSSTLPPVMLGCPADTARLGVSYSSALTASGGQPPFSFSILSGSLPNGLTLTAGSGGITGSPNTGGVFGFTAQVADSSGQAAGTVTTACSMTIPLPGSGPAASFQGQDTTTRGSWKGVYGKDGWIIANDSNHPLTYATATPAGASTWTWSPQSIDPRALQTGTSGSYSILSTFFSSTSFSFDFNPTDSLTHQVALYLLDLDSRSRAETVSIIDATSSTVLDSEPISNFNGGIYFIWTIKGHVVIQVTYTGGLNAVLSGLFFDTPSGGTPANTPPSVSITNPTPGTVSGTVSLSATASATTAGATMKSVQYQLDSTNLGNAILGTGPTFPAQWITTNTADGVHTLSAVATDSLGQSATSSISVTVSNGSSSGGASATFAKTDSATQGNWVNTYGQDGYLIANYATNPPAYATVTPIGASTWTWYSSTSDLRALLKSSSTTDRIASTFFASASFSFDVTLTGGPHQVALYLLDLDSTTRSEKISIIDPATQAVLNTQSFANFHNGVYAVWNLQGHVLIQVQLTGGLNPVVSGLFFGSSGSGTAPPAPPTVSISAPAANATLSGTTTITAQAQATAGMASVQFVLDSAAMGSPVTGPGPGYSFSWNTTAVSNGAHTLAAIATDTLGQSTTSASVPVSVLNSSAPPPGSASAVFLRADTSTHGNWKGTYGSDGSLIANDSSNLPGYAAVAPSGAALYTWSGSTSDPRALLKYSSTTDRIASTYFNYPTFTLDVNLSGTQTHQVALYLLDWDNGGRAETITISDAASNTVLDTRTVAGFQGGQYLVWNVTGHVTLLVKQQAGQNAVVSGLFFDTSGGSTGPNPPVISITAPVSGQTVSGTVGLSATVTAAAGVSSVQFQIDNNSLGPVSQNGSTYSYQWDSTTASGGSHTFLVSATDNSAQHTNASATFTVNNSTGGGASATFVKKDTTTHGSWKTVYGQNGEIIANDSNSQPSYGTASFSGAAQFTWTLTGDLAAPQQATGSSRTAATFYASPSFSLDVNLTDGNTHQLALYFLDWDNEGRSETVQILDAGSQQVLDIQSMASFQSGAYLVWNVKGHVTVRFTQITGANAVASGAFFGPPQ